MNFKEEIERVLKTPAGSDAHAPDFGFEALEQDGSTKLGISEQVLAEMARAALTRALPGVVFNDITAHRDSAGQLLTIDVDFMDEIHDPAPQSVCVDFTI